MINNRIEYSLIVAILLSSLTCLMLLLAFKKQIQPDKELHKIRSDIFIKDNYY